MILLVPILTTSPIQGSVKGWENVLLELGSEGLNRSCFPQVVAQKRPAEGSSAEPQPAYLAQDQSGQYYDAKRPRF